MSEWPVHGAFPHQHGDARGLMERIQAQLGERIEEAVEMAALKLMVDLRVATGRPAPESTSTADRAEFEAGSRALLGSLRDAYLAEPADSPITGSASSGISASTRSGGWPTRAGPGGSSGSSADPGGRLRAVLAEPGHGPEVLALLEGAGPLGVAIHQRRPESSQPVLAALDVGPQIGLETGRGVVPRARGDAVNQAVQLVLQQPLQGIHHGTSCGTYILNR